MNQWPQHKRELFEDLWYSGARSNLIGNIFGITADTVSARAHYHGLEPRGQGFRRNRSHDPRTDQQIIDAIVAEHRKKHSPWLSKQVASPATPTVSGRSLSIQHPWLEALLKNPPAPNQKLRDLMANPSPWEAA